MMSSWIHDGAAVILADEKENARQLLVPADDPKTPEVDDIRVLPGWLTGGLPPAMLDGIPLEDILNAASGNTDHPVPHPETV